MATTPFRILAADAFYPQAYSGADERLAWYTLGGRANLKKLIEAILLYDEITLPTDDFFVLFVLAKLVGTGFVIQLLESGKLRLVRIQGNISYGTPPVAAGGEPGFYLLARSDLPHSNGSIETDHALHNLAEFFKEQGLSPLLHEQLIEKQTQTIKAIDFLPTIGESVLHDVRSNESIAKWIGIGASQGNNLPSKPGVFQAMNLAAAPDDINNGHAKMLALLYARVEQHLAVISQTPDVSTHLSVARAWDNFAQINPRPLPSIIESFEVAGVPDFAELTLTQPRFFKKLLKISDCSDAAAFRSWFHANCRRSEQDLIRREIIHLLQREPSIQGMRSKLLRFALTTALGYVPVVGGLLGTAASFVDTIGADRLTVSCKPKAFLGRLRMLK